MTSGRAPTQRADRQGLNHGRGKLGHPDLPQSGSSIVPGAAARAHRMGWDQFSTLGAPVALSVSELAPGMMGPAPRCADTHPCDPIEKIGVSFLISRGAIRTAAVPAGVVATPDAVPDTAD